MYLFNNLENILKSLSQVFPGAIKTEEEGLLEEG